MHAAAAGVPGFRPAPRRACPARPRCRDPGCVTEAPPWSRRFTALICAVSRRTKCRRRDSVSHAGDRGRQHVHDGAIDSARSPSQSSNASRRSLFWLGRDALSRTSRASMTLGAHPSAVSSRAPTNATVPSQVRPVCRLAGAGRRTSAGRRACSLPFRAVRTHSATRSSRRRTRHQRRAKPDALSYLEGGNRPSPLPAICRAGPRLRPATRWPFGSRVGVIPVDGGIHQQ